MDNKKTPKLKKYLSKYCTLALADPEKQDKKTNATSPSETAVEQTRDWSIENKL